MSTSYLTIHERWVTKLRLEGILKIIQFQPPAMGKVTLISDTRESLVINLRGKKKKARETFPWKYGLGKGHPVSGTSSRSLLAESDKFFKQHNIFKSSRAKTQGCRIAQQALVKWMNQGIGRFITESNAMASVQILHLDWLGREEVTIKWGIRKFSPSPHTCSSSPESLQFDTLFLQGPNECNPQSRGAETEL